MIPHLILALGIAVGPQSGDTSLLEATVYTGLPTLALITGIFIYEIEANQRTSYGELTNNFVRGFTRRPAWDKNPWYVNYVGHPMVGAEAYLLARNRDHGMFSSFLYSTAESFLWEFGIESWIGARPSYQDLIFTSTLGFLLGELRFRIRALLSDSETTLGEVAFTLLDPIDSIYTFFEK